MDMRIQRPPGTLTARHFDRPALGANSNTPGHPCRHPCLQWPVTPLPCLLDGYDIKHWRCWAISSHHDDDDDDDGDDDDDEADDDDDDGKDVDADAHIR